MREFLEDANEHREDGYGRAQAHAKQELPKRFYKEAGVKPVVLLLADGRTFPANLTAKMFTFKDYPLFEAAPEAKDVPKVNFTR